MDQTLTHYMPGGEVQVFRAYINFFAKSVTKVDRTLTHYMPGG